MFRSTVVSSSPPAQLQLLATEPPTSPVVGLLVRLQRDHDQPCFANIAIIGSSKGMHHAVCGSP